MAEKKTARGLGRLYKRDAQGKECPANSHKKGTFWLAWREDGQRRRMRLEIDGVPVTDLETAKREQLRIRAPYLTGNRLEVLKNIEADIRRLEGIRQQEQDLATPPMALSAAWEAYVGAANRPDNGEDTRKHYKTIWSRFVKWLGDRHPDVVAMRDVTDTIAGEYMGELKGLGWTGNTYNKHLMFLRLIYRVLSKQARTGQNPFGEIVRRKQLMQSKRELTPDELYTVLTRAKGDFHLLFLIGAVTGFRLGDCATLLWAEVDLAAGVIRRKPGKTLRSSGKEVTIGIPSVLYKELIGRPEPHEGYVMPEYAAYFTCRPKRESILSRAIQRHFEACGIKTHKEGTGYKYHYDGKKKVYEKTQRAVVVVGFHSLRHTYASIHAREGTPQALIQDNMGHNNPAMTEHYMHVSDETARRIARAVDLTLLLGKDAQCDEGTDFMRQQLLRVVEHASGALLQKLLAVVSDYGV